jgi:hypothetical protein
MTSKTTMTFSPIKRCATSPTMKRRRFSSIGTQRKYQSNLPSSRSMTITIDCVQQSSLSSIVPDLVHDIIIEQQRRQTIVDIACLLRKVGDQIDERAQVNKDDTSMNSLIKFAVEFLDQR